MIKHHESLSWLKNIKTKNENRKSHKHRMQITLSHSHYAGTRNKRNTDDTEAKYPLFSQTIHTMIVP